MSGALRRAGALVARASNATSARAGRAMQTRGFASDPHGAPKVPYPWNDPMNPSRWKEEHVRASTRRRQARVPRRRARAETRD